MSLDRSSVGIRAFAALAALGVLAGCAQQPSKPAVQLPPGVDGYQCYLREKTADGFVNAEAYPDYRGGYTSHTMRWEFRNENGGSPDIHIVWTRGPQAISPPGWLDLTQVVRGELPPLHTQITLRLSSGEMLQKEFMDAKSWRDRKRDEVQWAGYGGLIHTQDAAFIDAFTRAAWADVDVVDKEGASYAHRRIDLSHIAQDLVVMRRLGAEVEANTADYANRCGAIHIEIDYR